MKEKYLKNVTSSMEKIVLAMLKDYGFERGYEDVVILEEEMVCTNHDSYRENGNFIVTLFALLQHSPHEVRARLRELAHYRDMDYLC